MRITTEMRHKDCEQLCLVGICASGSAGQAQKQARVELESSISLNP